MGAGRYIIVTSWLFAMLFQVRQYVSVIAGDIYAICISYSGGQLDICTSYGDRRSLSCGGFITRGEAGEGGQIERGNCYLLGLSAWMDQPHP